MSVIDFLTSGGSASIGGDLEESQRKIINDAVVAFGDRVRDYGRQLQVPASVLRVRQCSVLFGAKDTSNFHILFVDKIGENSFIYRDLSPHGRLLLETIVHQVRIDIGDVAWAFSFPIGANADGIIKLINDVAQQYVQTTLQLQQKPAIQASEEVLSNPELSSGLEKFRRDYPLGTKTAFIMMQFRTTKQHEAIDAALKSSLQQHGIVGLRADDKQYLDDLFPNVQVYMHACLFGVAIFDRITEDDFNPNVSLEVGYMLGMRKSVLLLKDKTLKSLSTDLTGKLYREFDTSDVAGTAPGQITKWLTDKGFA